MNPLTLFQGFEALHLDGRKMGKGVRAAAVGLNETKTFGIVEPFDRTTGHTMSPYFFRWLSLSNSWRICQCEVFPG
ncbi:hypothetical protein [Limnohabitans sp.]|uniref:hypothetical protein n=1 Tax=Limnohabitans sp. TaxID=1907725 RepID=UPI0025FC9979|nr:hypothetical protein [Limnohabitans sp.]